MLGVSVCLFVTHRETYHACVPQCVCSKLAVVLTTILQTTSKVHNNFVCTLCWQYNPSQAHINQHLYCVTWEHKYMYYTARLPRTHEHSCSTSWHSLCYVKLCILPVSICLSVFLSVCLAQYGCPGNGWAGWRDWPTQDRDQRIKVSAIQYEQCMLQAFLVTRWKLSTETSNTSRYWYSLGYVLVRKMIYCMACFAGDLDSSEDKLPTRDCCSRGISTFRLLMVV